MPTVNRATRRGAVVAELAVALIIAGMAAAIGVAILVSAERRTRSDGATDRSVQAIRDVARLLTGEIEASLPESVAVRGDTALDLMSMSARRWSALQLALPSSLPA